MVHTRNLITMDALRARANPPFGDAIADTTTQSPNEQISAEKSLVELNRATRTRQLDL